VHVGGQIRLADALERISAAAAPAVHGERPCRAREGMKPRASPVTVVDGHDSASPKRSGEPAIEMRGLP
jgi:hypothetical protein